jgi:hypothetical protein
MVSQLPYYHGRSLHDVFHFWLTQGEAPATVLDRLDEDLRRGLKDPVSDAISPCIVTTPPLPDGWKLIIYPDNGILSIGVLGPDGNVVSGRRVWLHAAQTFTILGKSRRAIYGALARPSPMVGSPEPVESADQPSREAAAQEAACKSPDEAESVAPAGHLPAADRAVITNAVHARHRPDIAPANPAARRLPWSQFWKHEVACRDNGPRPHGTLPHKEDYLTEVSGGPLVRLLYPHVTLDVSHLRLLKAALYRGDLERPRRKRNNSPS